MVYGGPRPILSAWHRKGNRPRRGTFLSSLTFHLPRIWRMFRRYRAHYPRWRNPPPEGLRIYLVLGQGKETWGTGRGCKSLEADMGQPASKFINQPQAAAIDRSHLARMTFGDRALEREVLQLFT